MILDAIHHSGGLAMSSPEKEISKWMHLSNSREGITVCLGVLDQLVSQGKIKPNDRVLVFNTGAAQKYPESVYIDLPKLDLSQPADWASFPLA